MGTAYLEGGVVRERGVERVADGEVDGGLEQVVLENDEPVMAARREHLSACRTRNGEGTYPVSIVDALPSRVWKIWNCSGPVYVPSSTRQSLVSNVAAAVRVQMMGRRPIALEIARTRLSAPAVSRANAGTGRRMTYRCRRTAGAWSSASRRALFGSPCASSRARRRSARSSWS